MGTAYFTGLRIALRRWPVVLILLFATVATGFAFAAMTWVWLSEALDSTLATRTLLTDLDMNVFIDLFAHHAEGFRMLVTGGATLAVIFALAGIWMNATAVVAVTSDHRAAECLRRGLSLYPTYLRLWIMMVLLNVGGAGGAFFFGRALTRWTAESANEASFYWALAAGTLIATALVIFFTTAHDHARVHCALTGKGAGRALVWALRFITVQERRALPLSVLLLATGLAAWMAYQAVAMLVRTDLTTGVLLSIVWGEALIVARMLLRIWAFGAAATLQAAEPRAQPWRS